VIEGSLILLEVDCNSQVIELYYEILKKEPEDTDTLLNKCDDLMKKGIDFSISVITISPFFIFYINKT
jgi:hypothetical protein